MPELPEVNTYQRFFDKTAKGQKIIAVEVWDDAIIRNMSGEEFMEKLRGRVFTGSYRKGKYLFGKLDNGHSVQLHFGMTGDLNYYIDEDGRSRHERFVFIFENGSRLGFDCPRKFARILYIENFEKYLLETGLGEDALLIAERDFLQLMEGKKGTLKGFLMNQKHIAGIGNLYADEICYQARIHPASRVDGLVRVLRLEVFVKMKEILQFAIDRNARYKVYPEDWLWQWRQEGAAGPNGESVVKRMKVAGRTTYYCEGRQLKY